MTAVVANGGHPVRPHVVASIQGLENAKLPKPVEPGLVADAAIWAAVHDAMHRVTLPGGTANASRTVLGLNVAGKTGTAQNPHGKDHALFVCFAPMESPTIAMAIVAENSGHGSDWAAPVAGALLRQVFLPDSLGVSERSPRAVVAPVDSAAD
jgi:penicillin-binding protein 2